MYLRKHLIGNKHLFSIMLALMLVSSLMAVVIPVKIAEAAPVGQVLILGPTVTGDMTSKEALAAIAAGKTPVVVDAVAWSAMTAADFASYDAIVLGDATCSTSTPYAAAAANANVWGPVVDGNIIIIGSDPVYHFSSRIGAQKLINQGMAFALAESGKTGAYLDLSCYYHFSPSGTPVTFLDGIEGGGFTVKGAEYLPGLNDVHITATHPALAGLTDAELSNWFNSVHEGFVTWPIGLEVLAIAKDATGSYVAPDGTKGYPYILARGVTIISDIKLAPETATNPLNTSHTLTATVTTDDPTPGTPVVGKTVTFTVIAGPHTGTTGTGTTDNAGKATFSYTGTTEGEDTIEATFVDSAGRTQRSNRVTKTWQEGGTTVPPTTVEVGGDINPVSKVALLTPWLVAAVILTTGTAILIWRRRTQS